MFWYIPICIWHYTQVTQFIFRVAIKKTWRFPIVPTPCHNVVLPLGVFGSSNWGLSEWLKPPIPDDDTAPRCGEKRTPLEIRLRVYDHSIHRSIFFKLFFCRVARPVFFGGGAHGLPVRTEPFTAKEIEELWSVQRWDWKFPHPFVPCMEIWVSWWNSLNSKKGSDQLQNRGVWPESVIGHLWDFTLHLVFVYNDWPNPLKS